MTRTIPQVAALWLGLRLREWGELLVLSSGEIELMHGDTLTRYGRRYGEGRQLDEEYRRRLDHSRRTRGLQ